MATAMPNDQEGKTAGTAKCSVCEKPERVKYCGECEAFLCTQCTLGHGKLKPTRHHKLDDVSQETSGVLNSGEGQIGLSCCVNHEGKPLSFYCEQCVDFLCESCQPQHFGHDVKHVGEDITLHQQVCRNHIKQLFDGEIDLDKEVKVLKSMTNICKEANGAVDDIEEEIVNDIKEKTKEVKTSLTALEDENSKSLDARKDDKVSIDAQLSKLYAIRNNNNCVLLSRELAESRAVLSKLSITREKSLLNVPEVTQILPNISHKHILKADIGEVLKLDEQYSKISTQQNTASTSSQLKLSPDIKVLPDKTDIPNPDTQGYKICRGDKRNIEDVILHSLGGLDIRILCPKSRSIVGKYRSNVRVNKMVSTAKGEYVCIESESKFVHLLDAKFNITFSRSGSVICDICYLSPHRFLMFSWSDQRKSTVCTMLVKDNHMVTENVLEVNVDSNPTHIDINKNKTIAYLCTKNTLYEVNLQSGESTHHSIQPYTDDLFSTLSSFVVDEHGNILLCTELQALMGASGKIFILELNGAIQRKQEINVAYGSARDVTIMAEHLIVSASKNEILFYPH